MSEKVLTPLYPPASGGTQGGKVGIVLGSDSDLEVMSSGIQTLEQLGTECELTGASAHRTPDHVAEYARTAADRGIAVIIAGAGWAAALPGALAAYTNLPVIGVPISSSPIGGLDALYSMVQMPPGVPVATVGIDTARNAAILAAQILALSNSELADRLEEYREKLRQLVEEKAAKVQGTTTNDTKE